MSTSKLNKRGFTLIEVVLVLAIGGLIFLLAFLAFGQATKNRRDTQRRSDAGRVISELQNASGDSNGKPLGSSPDQAALDKFVNAYLGGDGATGATLVTFTNNNIVYTVKYGTTPSSSTATSSTAYIAVSDQKKCDGNSMVAGATGDYAAVVQLEKGVACRDNQ